MLENQALGASDTLVSPVSLRLAPGGPGETSAIVKDHPEELSRVWGNEGGEGLRAGVSQVPSPQGPAYEALCSSQASWGSPTGSWRRPPGSLASVLGPWL